MPGLISKTIAATRSFGPAWLFRTLYDRALMFVAETAASRMSPVTAARFFARLGNRLGVDSCIRAGSLGSYRGSLRDESVFPLYIAHGTYDPRFQALLADSLFAEGTGTFVDIGANIGLTAIPVALQRHVACHAFEPEPGNFARLVRNIADNGVSALVKAENIAIFGSKGVLAFELSPDNLGDHRVRWRSPGEQAWLGEADWQVIEVPGTTLDDHFSGRRLDPPLVVKLDTQGSEVQAFRGGAAFFRDVDVLIVEFHPYVLKRMGETAQGFIDALRPFGFSHGLFDWESAPDGTTEPIAAVFGKMLDYWRQSAYTDFANLLFCRDGERRFSPPAAREPAALRG